MFEDVIAELKAKNAKLASTDTPATPRSAAHNGAQQGGEYEEIPPTSTLTACFVDGGNACVFDSPRARVEFVRVYATVYDGKERTRTAKNEGLVVIKNEDGTVTIDAHAPLTLSLAIPENHDQLRFGREGVSLATAANLARFLLECAFLKEHGKDCDLVVRDGPLVGNNEYEEQALAPLLDHDLVAGLCKTNTLANSTGPGPERPWLKDVKKDGDIGISLVRLHGKSDHVFRLDTRKDADAIAGYLSSLSLDAAFPGYPYPLIEADRFARVSNKELAMLKTRFMAEAGTDWKELERMATGSDAHSILDRLG